MSARGALSLSHFREVLFKSGMSALQARRASVEEHPVFPKSISDAWVLL